MLRQEEGAFELGLEMEHRVGQAGWQLIKVVVCTYERYRKDVQNVLPLTKEALMSPGMFFKLSNYCFKI